MTAAKVPLSERINLRMLIFFAVILIPIGYVVYLFADTWRTHGIWDAKDERFGSYKKVDLKAMSMFQLNQMAATDADIPVRHPYFAIGLTLVQSISKTLMIKPSSFFSSTFSAPSTMISSGKYPTALPLGV